MTLYTTSLSSLGMRPSDACPDAAPCGCSGNSPGSCDGPDDIEASTSNRVWLRLDPRAAVILDFDQHEGTRARLNTNREARPGFARVAV